MFSFLLLLLLLFFVSEDAGPSLVACVCDSPSSGVEHTQDDCVVDKEEEDPLLTILLRLSLSLFDEKPTGLDVVDGTDTNEDSEEGGSKGLLLFGSFLKDFSLVLANAVGENMSVDVGDSKRL